MIVTPKSVKGWPVLYLNIASNELRNKKHQKHKYTETNSLFPHWDKQEGLSLHFNLVSLNTKPIVESVIVGGHKWVQRKQRL